MCEVEDDEKRMEDGNSIRDVLDMLWMASEDMITEDIIVER